MLIYLAGILGLLFLLDRTIRSDRAEVRDFAVSHRFFALRDRVRMAAIQGSIDEWSFDFLDTSITGTIAFIERLSVWELLRLVANRGSDQEIAEVYDQLQSSLKKAGPEVTDLYNTFAFEWMKALSERHKLSIAFLSAVSKTTRWTSRAMESLKIPPLRGHYERFAKLQT